MSDRVIVGGNVAFNVWPGKFQLFPDGPIHDLNDDLETAMKKVAIVVSEARVSERKAIKEAINNAL